MKYKKQMTSSEFLDNKQLNKLFRSPKRFSTLLFEMSKVLQGDTSNKEKLSILSEISNIAMETLCHICLLDDGDEQPTNVKGLCKKHYYEHRKQFVKTERKYPLICSIPGCEDDHSAKGYCGLHYSRVVKQGLNPFDLKAMHAPKRTYGKSNGSTTSKL
ncbi:hypothetical protein [Paenibacillus agilis]|uniref:Potential DNA-binding domain-containing protein n=1 Tax=Paenibacillus agilis TaxID=3020863 RepID=A0A559ID52_9BACL|nr:hypothetical protein [Paenibacillus agilis]TVX85564.1 hypothetical protein FPZ44_24725 [Paenibacillus agilis]